MDAQVSISLLQNVIDTQKELVVIFEGDKPVLTNKSFNKFFAISSCEQYSQSFGAFVNNFVPHPSYFHKEKMPKDESWFDAIVKLPEIDRVVSIMTPSYEPHAFSVTIDTTTAQYTLVTFSDITQSLIKRIMIENHTNMDVKSGAYVKEYFLHISRSYQDAALFNEKIIAIILITLENNSKELSTFVQHFKNSTRQDDMLIRWSDGSLLLIYLVDNEKNAQQMMQKLLNVNSSDVLSESDYTLELFTQSKGESIKSLIKRIEQ